MSKAARLQVKGWREFQHYKDRNPLWIKLYAKLLTNYEFGQLTDAEKGQLVMIWLVASQHEGAIPNDAKWVANQAGLKGKLPLAKFVAQGWLEPVESSEPASKTLAIVPGSASPLVSESATLEEETETEREKASSFFSPTEIPTAEAA